MQKTTVTYMTQVIIIGVMGFVIFLFGCAASNRQLPRCNDPASWARPGGNRVYKLPQVLLASGLPSGSVAGYCQTDG